jgi:hypothetical protein
MEEIKIEVAKDFSKALGARYISEGKYSGEAFLEILRPKFLMARGQNTKLNIYLDGVFGYPSSFVSGSFGKLSIEFGSETLLRHLKLISTNSIRIDKIISEISNPRRK